MPKLNLRDDGFEEESNPLDSDQSVAPPPTLREVGVSGGGGKSSTLLTVVLLVVVVGGGVFALNYFKVIHLWGKRTPKITTEAMTDQLPAPETPAQGANGTDQGSRPLPMRRHRLPNRAWSPPRGRRLRRSRPRCRRRHGPRTGAMPRRRRSSLPPPPGAGTSPSRFHRGRARRWPRRKHRA